MDQNETLSPVLAQSILALLLFDNDAARLIQGTLPVEVWSVDRGILSLITQVYSYVGSYGEAPGDQILQLVDNLNTKDEVKDSLIRFVEVASQRFEKGINKEYVLSNLDKFHRQHVLKEAINLCSKMLEAGQLDKVEDVLNTALKQRRQNFDPGIQLSDVLRKLRENPELAIKDRVMLGIDAFDIRELVPKRKEMYLVAAGAKRGKSWCLNHIGKRALMENKKVCHLSLEMSDHISGKRYLQSLFSAATRQKNNYVVPQLQDNIYFENVERYALLSNSDDLDTIDVLLTKSNYLEENLRIKEFPTGSLSVSALKAYLDNLEATGFVPDLLIVDYIDLMKKSGDDLRIEIGKLYEEMRGIAGERNLILVTASQINREGMKEAKASDIHIAEAWTKVAIADTTIIYSQTDLERQHSLARLTVANARNEETGFTVLISQDYSRGQFVLSSVEMSPEWKQKHKEWLEVQKKEDGIAADKPKVMRTADKPNAMRTKITA